MAAGFGSFETFEDVENRTRSRLIEEARLKAQGQQEALVAAGGTPEEKLGLGIGAAFGSGLASGLGVGQPGEEQVAADPEVQAAMKRAEITKQLQAIPNPGTAAWYEQAAPLLAEGGMHEQALQFSLQGRQVKKQEIATDRATRKETKAQELAEWNALTSIQKAMRAGNEPESVPGNEDKTPKQLAKVSKDNTEWVESQKLIKQKQLEAMKASRSTKTTDKDIEQTTSVWDSLGAGKDLFQEWWQFGDSKDYNNFNTTQAQHANAVRDAASSKGVTVTPEQVARDLLSRAVKGGAATVDGEGNLVTLDYAKLSPFMAEQLDAFNPKKDAPVEAVVPVTPVAPVKRAPINLSSGAF